MLGQHIAVILQHHHVAIAYNPAIAEINEIRLGAWLPRMLRRWYSSRDGIGVSDEDVARHRPRYQSACRAGRQGLRFQIKPRGRTRRGERPASEMGGAGIESLARTYQRPALRKPFAAFPADSKVA